MRATPATAPAPPDEDARAVDIDAYLVPWHAPSNPYQPLLQEGLEAAGVRVEGKQRITAKLARRIARRRGRRAQAMHVHWVGGFLSERTLAGSVVSTARFLSRLWRLQRGGTRIVWTVHSLRDAEGPRQGWQRAAKMLLVRLADRAIVHSPGAAKETARYLRYPAHRLAVIPHGHLAGPYPNTIERDEARRRLEVAAGAQAYLFFGRLRSFKGVPELLDAFGSLPDPNAVLLIAGEQWDESVVRLVEQRAAADSRIRPHIGHVPDDDVQLYMNAADVVVLPFRDGVTSGSVVLAMSFGKAIIAARAPSLIDVPAEGGAFFYDSRDSGALRSALERAQDADLAAMGRRNREHVIAWDWERVGRLTRKVYEGQ